MKANSLTKKSMHIEEIYKAIEEGNKNGMCKYFVSHFTYVSDEVKLKLIEDGFKVYVGDWGGFEKNCLIIEW